MKPQLCFFPERPEKPRFSGLSMVMDKGLGIREASDLVETAGHLIDFIKLGFGTSLFTANVKEKAEIYRKAGVKTYVGGTLFEAFLIRNQLDDYYKWIDYLGLETVEISDGSISIPHDKKCELISNISKKYTVLSEVGSKEAGVIITPGRWIKMMQAELDAGSFKVIAEARESGTVGIYRPDGSAHTALINKIFEKVSGEKIIWEAPVKSQQTWFIKHFGANVNLGNIPPQEIISLETLRTGLRGDTFGMHLPSTQFSA